MIEYFLFHFLFVLSSASGAVPSVQKHYPLVHARMPPRKVLSSLQSLLTHSAASGGGLSFHWRVDGSADVYLTLLAEYLTFMVPEISPQLADSSLTPAENILTSLLLKSNSPLWSRIEVGAKYSSFFTGVLIEFWLNSYAYRLDADGTPRAEPGFLLPSIDFLQALQVTSRHVSNVFALSLVAPPTIEAVYIKLANEAFNYFRLSVYRYLRVALSVWPVDATLTLLIDFWLSLISPWFHLDAQIVPKQLPLDDSSPSFQSAWKPFIVSCFYLYQSIYAQFFCFAADAFEGFLASGECEDVNEAVSKLSSLISCLIEVMNPLLSVSSMLQELESEVSKSHSFIRFSSSIGAELQQQLRILEPETFKTKPLFNAEMRGTLVRIVICMESLVVSVLKRYQKPVEADAEEPVAVLTNRELFSQILENSQVPQSVKSLAKWTLQVREDFCVVFGLKGEELVQPANKPLPLWTGRKGRWMPLNAKAHLKHKMSAKGDIKDDVIRSYESALLVSVMKALSRQLTSLMRSCLLKPVEEHWNVRLPRIIWGAEINLRVFAAYPNLIFCVLIAVVARIALKIM